MYISGYCNTGNKRAVRVHHRTIKCTSVATATCRMLATKGLYEFTIAPSSVHQWLPQHAECWQQKGCTSSPSHHQVYISGYCNMQNAGNKRAVRVHHRTIKCTSVATATCRMLATKGLYEFTIAPSSVHQWLLQHAECWQQKACTSSPSHHQVYISGYCNMQNAGNKRAVRVHHRTSKCTSVATATRRMLATKGLYEFTIAPSSCLQFLNIDQSQACTYV